MTDTPMDDDTAPDTPAPNRSEDIPQPEHPIGWRLTARQALYRAMRHVLSVLRPQDLEFYKDGEWNYGQPNFTNAGPDVLRLADIEPFVRDYLLRSGTVTGYVDGCPALHVDLVKPEIFAAMLRGDDVEVRVAVGRSSNTFQEIRSIRGPLEFDPVELDEALANSNPEFDHEEESGEDPAAQSATNRVDAGGMKDPPLRIAVAIGHAVLAAKPDITFPAFFEQTQVHWENVKDTDQPGSPSYLKNLVRPLYDIAKAAREEQSLEEIENVAKRYLAEDEAKRRKINTKTSVKVMNKQKS